MKKNIRVLIVDDHQFFRKALVAPLYEEPQIEVVAEAENGLIAREMVLQFRPDVVLMDLHMPQLDGILATRQLLQEKFLNEEVALGIVAVTGDHDQEIAFRAMKAGVRGYLLKDSITDETLYSAIRAVYFGDSYFDGQVLQAILGTLSERRIYQPDESLKFQKMLKAEELRMIFDIASGKETAEIAHDYQVSAKTISNRLTKLYNLFGVANRVQLVTFALRNGLVSLSDI